jgi:hypothetical protein
MQAQLPEGGQWYEYDQGRPVDELAAGAAVAVGAAQPSLLATVAAAPPAEQPLGVPVKALLQVQT